MSNVEKNKRQGFVPIYRSIKSHWLWQNPRGESFSRGQAWIDILLSVNHSRRALVIGNQTIVLEPGQMWCSYKRLAERWGWAYKRVLRFINLLKQEEMIHAYGTPNGTTLVVVNWEFYAYQGQTDDTPRDTSDDTPRDTQTIINDKTFTRMGTKMGTNALYDAGERKIPTLEEVEAYTEEIDAPINSEVFFDVYEAKGWTINGAPIRDWKAVLRGWAKRSDCWEE